MATGEEIGAATAGGRGRGPTSPRLHRDPGDGACRRRRCSSPGVRATRRCDGVPPGGRDLERLAVLPGHRCRRAAGTGVIQLLGQPVGARHDRAPGRGRHGRGDVRDREYRRGIGERRGADGSGIGRRVGRRVTRRCVRRGGTAARAPCSTALKRGSSCHD